MLQGTIDSTLPINVHTTSPLYVYSQVLTFGRNPDADQTRPDPSLR